MKYQSSGGARGDVPCFNNASFQQRRLSAGEKWIWRIPPLDILPSHSATTVFLLIALILPGGAKTSHRQRHSQHYLCGRGARGYGTI